MHTMTNFRLTLIKTLNPLVVSFLIITTNNSSHKINKYNKINYSTFPNCNNNNSHKINRCNKINYSIFSSCNNNNKTCRTLCNKLIKIRFKILKISFRTR